jgi:hypothetical protein
MIHRDLARGAEVLNRTLQASPQALPTLIPLLGVGLLMLHRELLIHLWREE